MLVGFERALWRDAVALGMMVDVTNVLYGSALILGRVLGVQGIIALLLGRICLDQVFYVLLLMSCTVACSDLLVPCMRLT